MTAVLCLDARAVQELQADLIRPPSTLVDANGEPFYPQRFATEEERIAWLERDESNDWLEEL